MQLVEILIDLEGDRITVLCGGRAGTSGTPEKAMKCRHD
jgi:hypothetical protein